MNMFKQTMIGEILIARGAITREQLKMAKKFQETARKQGEALVDDGLVTPSTLDIALGWQLAETIVGLGYATERDVFGSLRVGVAKGNVKVRMSSQSINQYGADDLEDPSDF